MCACACVCAWESHLVEVRAGFWSYAFEDLHILNEELASGLDFCQSCPVLPGSTEGRVDHAVSPGGVEARCVGVYT